MIDHPIPPLFREDSEILILGSFPSVKSRENGFFYGHPQNRFWKVIAAVYNDAIPGSIEEKKNFLYKHKIAVWDVIASCDIDGSADSSIRNAVPTDLSIILSLAPIKKIFVNGKTAEKYYKKYQQNKIGIKATALPSTSPANASKSVYDLAEEWRWALCL